MMCSQIDKCCFTLTKPFSSSTYDAATFLSGPPSDACMEAAMKMGKCMHFEATNEPGLYEEFEKVQKARDTCLEEAAGDYAKKKTCFGNYLKFGGQHGCAAAADSVNIFCPPPSFEFEDFALDLAEELEDGESK